MNAQRRVVVTFTLLALAVGPLACGGAVEPIDPSCQTPNDTQSPATAPTTPATTGSSTTANSAGNNSGGTICRATSSVVEVSATTPWTDTGLDLAAGAIVTMTTAGTPRYGDVDAQTADADGGDYTGVSSWDDDVLPPPVPTESLIGKIGGTADLDTGAPVPPASAGDGDGFVGTSYRQSMTDAGRLFLGYNDQRPAFGDNSGAFSVTISVSCPAPPAPRIAFFGSAGSYDEDALMSFLGAYPATVTRDASNASPVTAASLANVDIVVLDALERTFDADEASAFASWVHAGGAVLSLTGYVDGDPTTWQRPNSLLADLPIQYAQPWMIGTGDDGGQICAHDVTTFSPSPVTGGLGTVPYCGGYAVTGGTTVATLDNAAVAATSEYGSGRVYVWGDEWVEYSTTWAGTNAQTFWQDAIDWLDHRS